MILGRDLGEWVMSVFRNNGGNLYTFQAAKTIYFAHTPSKCYIIEKKSGPKVLSLVSRNTVLFSNGVLIFPK